MPIHVMQGFNDTEVDQVIQETKGEFPDAKITKVPKDATWTLIVAVPDPDAEGQRDPGANVALVPDDTPDTPAVGAHEEALGVLSERYESNGDPGAVGEDRAGGPSYGMYQIATRTGTMKRFLNFLATINPDFAAKLNAAGGAEGALQRSATFENTWKTLAADPAFGCDQALQVNWDWRMRCLHETLFVIQRVRIPPD